MKLKTDEARKILEVSRVNPNPISQISQTRRHLTWHVGNPHLNLYLSRTLKFFVEQNSTSLSIFSNRTQRVLLLKAA